MDGWRADRDHAFFVEMSSAPKLFEFFFSFLAVERVFIDYVQILAVLFGKENDFALFGSSHEVETVIFLDYKLA